MTSSSQGFSIKLRARIGILSKEIDNFAGLSIESILLTLIRIYVHRIEWENVSRSGTVHGHIKYALDCWFVACLSLALFSFHIDFLWSKHMCHFISMENVSEMCVIL